MNSLYNIYHNGDTLDQETRDFIVKHHYSKTYRSLQQKHIFKLVDRSNKLVGIALYGKPMSKHYGPETLELRRLCLIDGTPKNTESFFIGHTLRWLRKHTDYDYIVSFADPNHGHVGTIYKASNFMYDGLEKSGNPRVVELEDGTRAHLRQLYQKKGGEYAEDAKKLQIMVAEGKARVLKQERKHRYLYNLRK